MHLLKIVRVRIKYYIKILFVLSLVVMVWVGLFFVLFWFGFLVFFFSTFVTIQKIQNLTFFLKLRKPAVSQIIV